MALCVCLAAFAATAQRGGGGARGGGGGFHGGGGGGFRGGGSGGGGFRGGGGFGYSGFRGGGGGGGFRGGGGFGYSGFRGGIGYGSYGYPGYYGGFYGYSYWPGTYNYGYSPYGYYPDSYDTSPNVTVIDPAPIQDAPGTAYAGRPDPVAGQYDQYGQQIKPSAEPSTGAAAPIYLLAFTDHVIRAAEAYWVDGKTLNYITLDYQQKQAPFDTVDRDLSLQLNRERRVPFWLPVP
jgi:hypothetical protein